MYKELNNSIKGFIPTTIELEEITNRFLKHQFIHSGDNLFGEMYEAWVYEYLKSWAYNNSDVTSFVIKDGKFRCYNSNGLDYDKNGQILYLKDGKKIAEYDGLFIYKDKVIFVESSVSELRNYYRKIEDKLIIKRDLLVKLFDTEEVYYLMITRPKKRSLVYRSLPHLILYKLKNPDLDSIIDSSRDTCKYKKPDIESFIDSNQVSMLNDKKFIDLSSISFSSSF